MDILITLYQQITVAEMLDIFNYTSPPNVYLLKKIASEIKVLGNIKK